MFTLNAKYVFWAIVALAAVSLFGYVVRLSGQVEHYRALADQNEVTIEALKDSTRIIAQYWDDAEQRAVAARLALPDEDSLKASIRADLLKQIEAAGGTLTGSAEVTTQRPEVTVEGESTSDGERADTLYFQFEDDAGFATAKAQIWVAPQDRQMTYILTLAPKPETFNFYTVEVTLPGGARGVEFWADAPGMVKKVQTYILPSALPERDAPNVTRQFYAGLRAMASSDGWFAIGPEVGTRGRLWFLDMEIGAGVDISKPVYHGFGQLKIGVTF